MTDLLDDTLRKELLTAVDSAVEEALSRRAEEGTSASPGAPPEFITVDELADLLRVNRKTIYEQFQKGIIPGGRRLSRNIRFHRRTVIDWMRGTVRGSRSQRREK